MELARILCRLHNNPNQMNLDRVVAGMKLINRKGILLQGPPYVLLLLQHTQGCLPQDKKVRAKAQAEHTHATNAPCRHNPYKDKC